MLQTQKLESLGLLAGGIAHDFNNLLTGVMGNASLALENLSADDESRPLLDQVVASSERAAELTRQLLAYAGKGRFVVDHVNLSDLVRETSALVHASIPRAVELRFDMERDLPLIEADASQIQQIIMNLVINAAEAIADSGIVEISTKRVAIVSDEELEPGCYVCLEITDTGCGMDADTQAKIFDPFFTTKFTGRGLGLAAVQGIVRSHKGALRLRSVLGQGTVFKVLFPASELRRLESAERNQERKEQRGAGIVLIIDDEPVVGRVATGALSQLGYQVRTASSGYEGLAAFAENYQEIRVVLLDLTMPGLSSKEIFAKLKAVKPNVPVILSSGFSEMEVLKSFTADSISGFLQKPYTAAQLRDVIGAAISEPLADQPRPSSLSFAPGSVA
jgi:CheY-like chemotaxis protein/two-component sensor histidine kinase